MTFREKKRRVSLIAQFFREKKKGVKMKCKCGAKMMQLFILDKFVYICPNYDGMKKGAHQVVIEPAKTFEIKDAHRLPIPAR